MIGCWRMCSLFMFHCGAVLPVDATQHRRKPSCTTESLATLPTLWSVHLVDNVLLERIKTRRFLGEESTVPIIELLWQAIIRLRDRTSLNWLVQQIEKPLTAKVNDLVTVQWVVGVLRMEEHKTGSTTPTSTDDRPSIHYLNLSTLIGQRTLGTEIPVVTRLPEGRRRPGLCKCKQWMCKWSLGEFGCFRPFFSPVVLC